MLCRRCLSARLGMMRFCNTSGVFSPVTLKVSKSEYLISSKKKSQITIDVVNLHHTVTFSSCSGLSGSGLESSGIFSSRNFIVVGVDRPLKFEMSFASPQNTLDNQFSLVVIFLNIHTTNALRFIQLSVNNSS